MSFNRQRSPLIFPYPISDDAHELDRVVNPEQYRHRIDDPRSSAMHGESGEGDEPFERDRK